MFDLGGARRGRLLLVVGFFSFFLLVKVNRYLTAGSCSRDGLFAVGASRGAIGRIFRRVRGGDRCVVFCVSRVVSAGHGMGVSMGGRRIDTVLSRLFLNASGACDVGSQRVAVCRGNRRPGDRRRDGGFVIANMVASTRKRSVVNISMGMGKAALKKVSSVSKQCSVDIPGGGSVLVISFLNCTARRVGVGKQHGVGVQLHRSAGTLSRMIIVNCKRRGGRDIIMSVDSMGPSRVTTPAQGLAGGLTKRMSNLVTMRHSNRPKCSSTRF